jgi:mannosyl-3-phosphoglycerate synthase
MEGNYNMDIHTMRFSSILDTNELGALNSFLSRTAFVVSHKSESIATLLGVLWYLPVNSPIIVVTNCPEGDKEDIKRGLTEYLTHHKKIYLVHQKDETIARFFKECGVCHILGKDGKVVDGKGEGMYIGTLCALQLGYAQWIIFYDADNLVPCALLEYTLAMSRLFLAVRSPLLSPQSDTLVLRGQAESHISPDLHTVRICWSSKPELGSGNLETKVIGRCTQVVSPLFSGLLEAWFGLRDARMSSSNAGEQGMTIKTAKTVRFSSGFSVEAFQLLDLLFNAAQRKDQSERVLFQQYLSQSPHFHTKKRDEHIRRLIEDSLGGFFLFEQWLPQNMRQQLQRVYDDLCLDLRYPVVYPPLQDVQFEGHGMFVNQYKLCRGVVRRESKDGLSEASELRVL